MKKRSGDFSKVLVACVFLAGALFAAGPAHATWYWIHGHEGHVEFMDNVADPALHRGWGLDIYQHSSTDNWVHFAVPTIGDATTGVRYIRVKFYSPSSDSWVSEVAVYNGKDPIGGKTGKWANGEKTINVDLGAVTNFSCGLGISVKINAGSEKASHEIVFRAVGANFVSK